MATATSSNPDKNLKRGFRKVVSDVEVVADTIVIDGLTPEMSHCFVGVQFFADAGGATPAVPGAGTVVVTVETVNNENVFEALTVDTITGATPVVILFDLNALRVKLVPTGITTATHWRAVWTGNRT